MLACDIGTTAAKTILINTKGNVIATARHPYPTYFLEHGGVEQNPNDWWKAVIKTTCKIIKENYVSPSNIISIGVGGQMTSCLPINEEGEPLRRCMIHMDRRSKSQVSCLTEEAKKTYYNITGFPIGPRQTLQKIGWIKENEAETFDATFKFVQVKDYIVFKLTGIIGTDYSDASLAGLLDIRKKKYSETILDQFEIPIEKLPDVNSSIDIIGEVSAKAAKATALAEGTPVIAGAGDDACAVVGAGALDKISAIINLGGGMWGAIILDKPIFDGHNNILELDPNYVRHEAGALATGGMCYRWIQDQVFVFEKALSKILGRNSNMFFDYRASLVNPGSDGLIFLPYLLGSTRGMEKACFYGLTPSHTSDHFIRSVLEGVAYEIRRIMEGLKECSFEVEDIRLTGGGSRSKIWCEIISDVMGKRILIPSNASYVAAFGAALAAATGVNVFNDLKTAQRSVRIDATYSPTMTRYKKYTQFYKIYKQLSNLLTLKIEEK